MVKQVHRPKSNLQEKVHRKYIDPKPFVITVNGATYGVMSKQYAILPNLDCRLLCSLTYRIALELGGILSARTKRNSTHISTELKKKL